MDKQKILKIDLTISLVGFDEKLCVNNEDSPLNPVLLESWDFTTGVPRDKWATGSQNGGALNFSKGFLNGVYPVGGGVPMWAVYTPTEALDQVYIEFDARMSSNVKHGLKFLKIFGKDTGVGYANFTTGLDYTGVDNGSLQAVSFGDGVNHENDTGSVILLNGAYPTWIGRSYGSASVATPQSTAWASSNWGTDWHHFKMMFKYNSGSTTENEVADGEFYLNIDGLDYVVASGLFNSNPGNTKEIKSIELLGYSNGTASDSFTIDYDNVVFSKGGFMS